MKQHLDNMNGSQLQRMYRQNDISSGEANTNRSRCRHTGHHGVFLAMHSMTAPPVEAYRDWLDNRSVANNGGDRGPTYEKLRRMVVMRRQGSSFAEIGRAVGLRGNSVSRWLAMLPPELAA